VLSAEARPGDGDGSGGGYFPAQEVVPSFLCTGCILLPNCGWHLVFKFTKLFRKAERYTEKASVRGDAVSPNPGVHGDKACFRIRFHSGPILVGFSVKPWSGSSSARKLRGL
jgi:hypothetical protein